MCFIGIDIGSLSTDIVVLNEDKSLAYAEVAPTGANAKTAIAQALEGASKVLGFSLSQVSSLVSTGYGRSSLPMEQLAQVPTKAITEITCHARGVHHLLPNTRVIIDIGGQDSKVIMIDNNARVKNFMMNDKCAAGTGRFLEVMAKTLEIPLQDLGETASEADRELSISSICTVFAESEVVSLVAKGEKKANIIQGLHQAISNRIVGMLMKRRFF